MFKNLVTLETFKNISKVCPIKKIQHDNTNIVLIVRTKDILKTLLFFKNHFLFQFKILTCISGVDYPKNYYRFVVVYDLLSIRYNTRLRVKIFTYELGYVFSSTSIFASSGWFESEIWDMFGVFFKNHANLKRILTDYGFNGYPLRKDFPLSGFIEMRYNETLKRVVNESIELNQEYRTFNFLSPWVV